MVDSQLIFQLNPSQLAYLGDAVYELYVRRHIVKTLKNCSSLNKMAKDFVSSQSQNELMEILMPMLTDKEKSVYKSGRNSKVLSKPKNAKLDNYHSATGFEALWGYLYLNEEFSRLDELFEKIAQYISNKEKIILGDKEIEKR